MPHKIMHFKSKKSYQKWLGFGHSTKVFEKTPGNQIIFIGGKRHHVKHKGRR